MILGPTVALKIFDSERSTACIAHETITNPTLELNYNFIGPSSSTDFPRQLH